MAWSSCSEQKYRLHHTRLRVRSSCNADCWSLAGAEAEAELSLCDCKEKARSEKRETRNTNRERARRWLHSRRPGQSWTVYPPGIEFQPIGTFSAPQRCYNSQSQHNITAPRAPPGLAHSRQLPSSLIGQDILGIPLARQLPLTPDRRSQHYCMYDFSAILII